MLDEKNPYIKYIPIFLTLIILCLGGLIFYPKKDFSENENRYLQKFPTLSFETIKDTSFMTKLENYTSDRFAFRKTFLSTKAKTEILLGKDENKNVYIGKDDYLIEKYEPFSNQEIKKLTQVLNNFQEKNKDKKISIMLIPTSITINEDKLPKYSETKKQQSDLEEIYINLNKFNTIDTLTSLKKGKEKYQMFYRLDHHWTTYGAYYGYLAFMEQTGKTPLQLTDFNKKIVTDKFQGTLYSKSNIYDRKPDEIIILETKNTPKYKVEYVLENKETTTFYEEKWLEQKDKYSYFLDNNHPLIKITNQSNNTKDNILIIKDSFANSFIPIIANNYSKVHVIDPRFYKYSITDYIKENNIEEILLLYNMNTLKEDLGIQSIR